jgi:predicted nucleic acid-binding protein
VILLDATVLVSFLAGERAAGEVASILRGGEAAIPSVNLAETLDVMMRVFGYEADALEAKLVPLLTTTLGLVSIGEAEARRGAAVRAAHYHRQRAPLSLADCLLIAAASLLQASIATSDEILAAVARREGIDVTRLPAGDRRRS